LYLSDNLRERRATERRFSNTNELEENAHKHIIIGKKKYFVILEYIWV